MAFLLCSISLHRHADSFAAQHDLVVVPTALDAPNHHWQLADRPHCLDGNFHSEAPPNITNTTGAAIKTFWPKDFSTANAAR